MTSPTCKCITNQYMGCGGIDGVEIEGNWWRKEILEKVFRSKKERASSASCLEIKITYRCSKCFPPWGANFNCFEQQK